MTKSGSESAERMRKPGIRLGLTIGDFSVYREVKTECYCMLLTDSRESLEDWWSAEMIWGHWGVDVYGVQMAKIMRRRRRQRCKIQWQFSIDWKVVRRRAESGGDRRCERSVRRWNDKVESVIPVVCWKVDMLREVEGRKKRQELRNKVISRIVKVDIEVAGYYKFMRSGGSKR